MEQTIIKRGVLMASKNNHFGTVYQQYIYKSRYAKYIDKDKKREDWNETVERYFDFFEEFIKERQNFDLKEYRKELEDSVLSLKVMPSMRGLMTAGAALKRDEAAIYNCSYLPIDSIRSFDEELYSLMLGSGVGFSVESFDVSNIPILPETFHESNITVSFEDSRIGWAKGYREFLALLLSGQIPNYDISALRPKGARLKTFGGRSSGPDPLVDLLKFTTNLFINAAGRKLNTLECHDIACKIADIVVVGGVRRSALISLSDLSDDRLRTAKSGAWWDATPHRRLANNSAIYEDNPPVGVFMKEWLSLYESKSGERGIFSRKAAKHIINYSNKKRKEWFGEEVRVRDPNHRFGSNPCCVSGDTIVNVKIDGVDMNMNMSSVVDYFKENKNSVIEIRSWNFETKSVEYNKISFADLTRKNGKMLKITDTKSGKSIKVTPDHNIWTENRGWVEAQYLQGDDILKII